MLVDIDPSPYSDSFFQRNFHCTSMTCNSTVTNKLYPGIILSWSCNISRVRSFDFYVMFTT